MTAARRVAHASCPSCGGSLHLTPPKRAGETDPRAWVRPLREREGRSRGVTDGFTYATRRSAQARAAHYRRALAERGLKTESVTRPKYCYAALSWKWTFVLWKDGSRPVREVEVAWIAHEQGKAERAAESIDRGWL